MNKDFADHLYWRSAADRRQIIADHFDFTEAQRQLMSDHATKLGNEMVENYLTNYGLPEGVCTGLVVNGHRYTVPMVTEEPSVIAAACNGAMRVGRCGGFTAEKQSRQVIGQVVVKGSTGPGAQWLNAHQQEMVEIANSAHPSLARRGGGAQKVRIRHCGAFFSCDLFVDVSQSMGANSVDTMAEAVARYLCKAGFDVVTAILSNLATGEVQTATCRVDARKLATSQMSGIQVARRIAELSDLAAVDPYRAATNNKGIMNGIDAVLIATGNDWRAVESGAHAWACRGGSYAGLSQWQVDGNDLIGTISLPLPVGVVGGSIGLNPQTRLNLKISQIKTAEELAAVIASLGLAQNLAALRALVTTGIQAGHMKLQYRSLAVAVGAKGTEVDQLAQRLGKLQRVDQTVAQDELQQLRKDKQDE